MSKKKKVTAPLTYNPGKGRPKEHLAYLNWQEMQALKRLNGNNQERGPRGLPSFPPAGAMSGGSAKSPASTSKAAGAGSRPSSGGPRSGMSGSVSPTSGSPRGSNPSSNFGGGGGGGGGFKPGPSVGPKAPSFGGGGGSGVTSSANRGASPGSIGRSDKAAINAVNSANTKAALKTPAISADRPRTLNVGPMGTPVSVKTGQAGSQIKGAIQSVKAPAPPKQDVARGVTVPSATVTTQQLSPSAARAAMGDVAPTRSIYKTVAEADRAIVAKATQTYNQRFGTNYTPDQYSRLAKTVAGEAAGESDFARAAVANTFGNRTALAQQEGSPYGYMGGGDFASLVGQYDAYRMQNDPYRAAVPGSKTYQQGVNAMYQAINPESTFSKTASPKVLTATHYYNPAEVRREPDWARDKTKFERVGSHLFGTAEASPKTVAKARAEQIARAGTTIVPTSSTPERAAVPGLIKYPDLARPPSVGRSAVVPTVRPGKIITDRVLQEPSYRPYDIRVTSPPAPIMDVSFDTGVKNKYQDRIFPQSEYAGYGDFAPPQITAGLSRNPFDTQTAGGYSGYGSFTPPVRTANLDRNVYDVGRTPSIYSGITDFNVPNRTADISRNQFDTRVSAPKYSGYGEFTAPAQEKILGVESLVNANITRNPYDVQRSAEAKTPESIVGSREIKIDGIGTLSIEDALKRVPEQKREAVRQELALEYEAGITNFSKENFDSLVKRADYDPDFDYSGLEAASESDSTATSEEGNVPEGETSPHPFQGMDQEQEANVDETLNRVKKAQQVGGPIVGVATGLPVGLITRPLTKKYMEGVKERLNKYAAMTRDEKLAAEKKDPSLIGWGRVAGIPSVSDYSVYTSWAEKSGLRAPPSREGGRDNSGIASLVDKPKGDETTTPTPDTPSTTPGRRPDIYYMWDLGVNIPSPGDPNYTQYQTYLAERLAAQRAMG